MTNVAAHQATELNNRFTLAGVWLAPVNELTADNRAALTTPTLLEATANHPVLAASGVESPTRKALGDVKAGEILYRYDATTSGVSAYKVVRIEKSVRSVTSVYSLATESGAYLVDATVVLDK